MPALGDCYKLWHWAGSGFLASRSYLKAYRWQTKDVTSSDDQTSALIHRLFVRFILPILPLVEDRM